MFDRSDLERPVSEFPARDRIPSAARVALIGSAFGPNNESMQCAMPFNSETTDISTSRDSINSES